MTENNHRNESILGTFLSGALGTTIIFVLAILLSTFVPVVVFIAAILYLAWFFVSPILRKSTQAASLQVQDDD